MECMEQPHKCMPGRVGHGVRTSMVAVVGTGKDKQAPSICEEIHGGMSCELLLRE